MRTDTYDPNKWQLVPVEPTDDMVIAFAEEWYCHRQAIDDPQMNEAYAAMLAAAPAHPATAGDAEDAARYRLIRRKVCIAGGQFHVLNLHPRYVAPDAAIELDAAIDAMRASEVKA